jgi:hypothetical protein
MYHPAQLQQLYARLHRHYIGEEESHYTLELIDPEEYYKGLTTFALWIMTEPDSERTQALATEYDAILTQVHEAMKNSMSDGQPTDGCRCMERYLRDKVDQCVAKEDHEGMEKWEHRLQLLR